MFSGHHGGRSMTSGGRAGSVASTQPPRANQMRVNTRERSSPPASRMNAAAFPCATPSAGRRPGAGRHRPRPSSRGRPGRRSNVAQVPSARCWARIQRAVLAVTRVGDAEEVAQEQVLGVDRDVGLQLALPPAGSVLHGEEGVGAPVEGVLDGRVGAAHRSRSQTNSASSTSSAGGREGVEGGARRSASRAAARCSRARPRCARGRRSTR